MPKLTEIAKKLFLILINYFLKKQDVLFFIDLRLKQFSSFPTPPPTSPSFQGKREPLCQSKLICSDRE